MPTQKDVKATRKLKRRATKVNNRRRNIGKQPLSFKHFYKTSHKRNRNQFESKRRNDNNNNVKVPPHKRRKFNNNKIRSAPFGFGNNMNATEEEYQAFLAEINESDSDAQSETNDSNENNTIEIETKQAMADELINENEHITAEIKQHQKALHSLANADPEFYKHLQEMDGGNLLSFGEKNQFDLANLGNIDDTVHEIQKDKINKTVQTVHEMHMQMDDTSNDNKTNDNTSNEINDINAFMKEQNDSELSDSDMDSQNSENNDMMDDTMFEFNATELQYLIKDLEENKSVNAMKQMLNGFCSFVELTIEDKKQNKKISKKSVSVANNPAFQKLLHYILTKLGTKVCDILNISIKQQTARNIPYRSTFNRYFKYLYIFFEHVSDSSMLRLYLIHCKHLVSIILSLNESIKRLYVKQICKLWSSTAPNVRIDAFIFLYEMGRRMNDAELLNLLLKYMYSSYVRICKRVSIQTMPGIKFMINCMAEIYLLNPVLSYRDAFRRLRCIAFHVKQSITIMAKHESKHINTKEIRAKKLKQYKLETIRSIYNWRFLNIIRLWSKILSSHAHKKNSDLYLLYYPFIQICCSVLTLTRSAAYNPGRIKIIQSLIDLIHQCSKSTIMDRKVLYVPLAPYLISIINNPAFHKKNNTHKKEEEKEKAFDMWHKIKIGDSDFNTSYLHYSLLNNAIKLMILYFCNYSYQISFPEISFPTQIFLKEFLSNENISTHMKSKIKILSNKLKDNSNWIVNKRKNVQFSPKDFEKIESFLANERLNEMSPLSKFVKSKQFEIIITESNNNENKNSNDNKKPRNKKDMNKQIRKEKKQRKKKNKMENKIKREKAIKENKIVNDLKNIYEKNKTSKHTIISGLGDIVQDFQLSDDD